MRAYIIAITFIAAIQIYYCINKDISPLSWELLLLITSPFLFFVWKDVASIKFGSSGLELERVKNDVNASIKKVAHGGVIDPKHLDSIFKSVETNEWATLVLSRMLMRKGLIMLAPKDHNLGASPSLSGLLLLCQELGSISKEEATDLERLRNITFYAEWWSGNIPSYGEWQWALSNCKAMVRSLFAKQPIA